MKIPLSANFYDNDRYRWLLAVCWLVAVILGALHAWADRFAMNADGISYLDMGDAYLRGDWGTAINGYWSPLYSWLLGLAIFLLRPTPYWEFPVAHLVNFVIYLCALVCFHFFSRELIRFNQSRADRLSGDPGVTLPTWAWIALGYSLFIYSSLTLLTVWEVTPDMCVAAFVYLISGILLRIRRGSASWVTFGVLGLLLGAGYLAKAAMFPLAFVFLGATLFWVDNFPRTVPRVLLALTVFLSIAGPFIGVLSLTKGRLTFSDSGRVTYAQFVNGTPARHWQGTWPPDSGTPKHPTRKISNVPTVYEFENPIGGTYPPWYDPSYWSEGAAFRFDWGAQRKVLLLNAETYFDLFFRSQGGLVVGFLVLFIMGRPWSSLRYLVEYWGFFIPAIAALGMYALVHVESRFIAAFVVLIWMGVACAVRLSDSPESYRLLTSVSIAMLTIMVITIGFATVPKAYATTRDVLKGLDASAHEHWQVADGLSRLGVQPGDKVAILGQGTPKFGAYWARLARARIIAEVHSRDVDYFWAADPIAKAHVINSLVYTGAKAIVTDGIPNRISTDGWQRIGNTSHFVYLLSVSSSS